MKYNEIVDQIEEELVALGTAIDCPVKHYFTDGLYCREIFMPAGTTLTSKIHKTQHPYVVSKGEVSVIKEDNGVERIKAPYFGITEPNTRRVLHVHEDTIWTTFHKTNVKPKDNSKEEVEKAVLKIENKIIKKHNNKLLHKREEIK